ncbi:uncharacterized protein LOC110018968 [Phalaenopsis equestris]|uniref:uncharacterized protein LOC110018968 n=1 Tax=Phalaenopsis equestris TaxID=78828 RepID=UPI0009E4BCDA|nr:uncharacterized protein LOC110018968 [Phalaenopsis equestris]
MEEKQLDFLLVPLGLFVLALYHAWLLFSVLRRPNTTVIGLNAFARRRWVQAMMADSLKNGVLAVQTIRNNIMASTVLATTAITLASLISVFVSATSKSSTSSALVYGNKTSLASSTKLFAISLCFILAFLCHIQAIRYYAHVSFLVTTPPSVIDSRGDLVSVKYVGRSLNRGSLFWSLGLRAFYVSFTLFLWIFGPIPMFVSCIVMCSLLYFLDTTTEHTRDLHRSFCPMENEEAEHNV